jgi:hypothetical protein
MLGLLPELIEQIVIHQAREGVTTPLGVKLESGPKRSPP